MTYLLPADGVFSYRLVRGRPLDREAGRTRDGWFRVHRAGEADPRCPESIPHAHGSRSSVSFWYRDGGDRGDMGAPGELTHRLRRLRGLGDRRLIVQAGTEERSMIAQAEGFADAASAAGMTVSLAPWRGGHDYACWRHGLVHALRGLEASGG